MLELIFNPFYDQPVYSGDRKAGTGFMRKKYVGKLGLLAELELRLGLTGPDIPDATRLLGYYEAVAKVESGLFFHKSFENDSLGVTRTLLAWRDALVYVGWKRSLFFTEEESVLEGLSMSAVQKLTGLYRIEKEFEKQKKYKGLSDRWMDVMDAVSVLNPLLGCFDDLSHLHVMVHMDETVFSRYDPMLYRLLQVLHENCHAGLDFCKVPSSEIKLHLYEIPDQMEAYQWVLAGDHSSDPSLKVLDEAVKDQSILFVNEENVALNGVLDCLKQINVASDYTGVNTSILQLFRTGIAQFRIPVDLDNLQNYLSSSYHPLNDFKKIIKNHAGDEYEVTLKKSLADYLKNQHGFGVGNFGDSWKDILNDQYVADNPSAKWSDYLGFWDSKEVSLDINGDCCIQVQVIRDYCQKMGRWCHGKSCTRENNIREQLDWVASCFEALDSWLGNQKETSISYEELMKVVEVVSRLGTFSSKKEKLGALRVIPSVGNIAEPINHPVVWLDCFDKGNSLYDWDFLIRQDLDQLVSVGKMWLPSHEGVAEGEYSSLKMGISRVDELYIIWPRKVNGETREKHPFWIECEKQMKVNPVLIQNWNFDKAHTRLVSRKKVEANSQQMEHQVNISILKGLGIPYGQPGSSRREYESASSLEMLLNNPFDYLLEYIYDLKESSICNLSVIKGLVAHLLIHQAFVTLGGEKRPVSASQLENYFQQDWEQKLMTAVRDTGGCLLDPKNHFEFERFKNTLQSESLPHLISIMKEADLKMVGSEFPIKGTQLIERSGTILCQLSGFIDCIMMNASGEVFIFDFKWTDGSEDKRMLEIAENRELQLAIYQLAIDQMLAKGIFAGCTAAQEVKGVGYYMLRQGLLLTNCNSFHQLSHTRFISSKGSYFVLLSKICHLYQFRMNQLSGQNRATSIIEEGELMAGQESEYLTEIKEISSKLKEGKPVDELYEIAGLGSRLTLKKESTYNRNQVLKGILK